MREFIVRALMWVSAHLTLTRRTRPGRHTAEHFANRPAGPPSGTTPGRVSAWARPWTGPSAAEARAIFRAEEARHLSPEQRERYYATAWAERGYDYPYTAPGVHQVRTGATA
ncbi:hypothetical protein ACSMX9_13025 [Streptomyces sp. LE64]|uniref:hypothetical protein n=1 Tax=Streptomyces sp. LE64 TaxID=3448653 RepID=UPI0040421A0C